MPPCLTVRGHRCAPECIGIGATGRTSAMPGPCGRWGVKVLKRFAAICAGALSVFSTTAYAADVPAPPSFPQVPWLSGFFVHVGPAAVILNESAP